ncbi:UbiA family prenyltransferase [Nocardia sp. NPDC055321]
MDAYHQFYGWLLAVLLLRADTTLTGRETLALGLVLVTLLGIKCATCAADDIIGFRNGGDAMNYQTEEYRPPRRKPLLTGVLSEREAVVFTTISACVGLAFGVAALWALDWRAPIGAVVLFILMSVFAVQYSAGVKFSYHPGGLEFVVFFVSACTVLVPYWLVAHTISATALTLGLLMGMWLVLVVSYANIPDREGDAAVGRRTIAVLVTPRAFNVFLTAQCVVTIGLTLLPFVRGPLDTVTVLCVVPVLVMNVIQFYFGVLRGQALRARMIGFFAIDVGSIGFAAAIVLSSGSAL